MPWIETHKRPATVQGYTILWEKHLKPLCGSIWLKETRTYYIKTAAGDIHAAMERSCETCYVPKLEDTVGSLQDTVGTPEGKSIVM